MQREQFSNKLMTKRSLQEKLLFERESNDERRPSSSFYQGSSVQFNFRQHNNIGKYPPLMSDRKIFKGQMSNNVQQQGINRNFQKSININIKSNTKELIESKEYENKLISEWTPVFPNINQEESFDMSERGKTRQSNSQKNTSQSEEQKFVNGNELFQQKNQQSCSFEDIQKLSKAYCQVILKQDTKKIKKLNNLNQQLKTVCKQIVSALRKDSNKTNNQKSVQLTLKQIHTVIMNYQKKKKL